MQSTGISTKTQQTAIAQVHHITNDKRCTQLSFQPQNRHWSRFSAGLCINCDVVLIDLRYWSTILCVCLSSWLSLVHVNLGLYTLYATPCTTIITVGKQAMQTKNAVTPTRLSSGATASREARLKLLPLLQQKNATFCFCRITNSLSLVAGSTPLNRSSNRSDTYRVIDK